MHTPRPRPHTPVALIALLALIPACAGCQAEHDPVPLPSTPRPDAQTVAEPSPTHETGPATDISRGTSQSATSNLDLIIWKPPLCWLMV